MSVSSSENGLSPPHWELRLEVKQICSYCVKRARTRKGPATRHHALTCPNSGGALRRQYSFRSSPTQYLRVFRVRRVLRGHLFEAQRHLRWLERRRMDIVAGYHRVQNRHQYYITVASPFTYLSRRHAAHQAGAAASAAEITQVLNLRRSCLGRNYGLHCIQVRFDALGALGPGARRAPQIKSASLLLSNEGPP